MRLLFIAADPIEFRGMLRHCRTAHPYPVSVHWARRGKLAGNDVLLAANGAGRARAASAFDATFQPFAPDAVISTGFCGALDPSLTLAHVVTATCVAGGGECFETQVLAAPRAGVDCTVDYVACTAEEKNTLRESGGTIVEMEAAGVAARAKERGVPFYCVRSVTDLAGESFENDFNSALRSDGHFDKMLILRGTLRRPMARLPELFRLRSRSVRAARALGDFFADCRF
jgi:nucleoside phosphorylase